MMRSASLRRARFSDHRSIFICWIWRPYERVIDDFVDRSTWRHNFEFEIWISNERPLQQLYIAQKSPPFKPFLFFFFPVFLIFLKLPEDITSSFLNGIGWNQRQIEEEVEDYDLVTVWGRILEGIGVQQTKQ